ncbi:MAG: aspartate aminotransferase family protein [Candidatus Hodarchaeota archaeon]
MNRSEEIKEKAHKHLITSMVSKLEPVVIDKAYGAIIKDIEGKEFIDCFAGLSVVNAGHCQPKINQAAIEQAKKLVHACTYLYYIEPAINLAEKLAEITPPNLEMSFFGNSGAEAVEAALKLARKFSKKYEILALMNSFHGRTFGCLSITGQSSRKKYDMGPYLPGVAFASPPYCYRCPFEKEYPSCDILCARSIENTIEYCTSKGIAAFIAEPVLGEGGIIVPPPEYFKVAKEILDNHEILFIDDEVQTGFCRTGKFFAIDHFNINPDIMTMAKGIANGFPLGACTTRTDIGNSFEPGDHFSSFGANPICSAAALANIDFLLEERLAEKSADDGKYLLNRLENMKEKYLIIGDVRGLGLMIGVELVKDHQKKIPAKEETLKIRDMCRENGLLIGSGGVKGNVLRIQPPLVIRRQQLDKTLEILESALKKYS